MKTHRQVGIYRLVEGTGMGIGCFAISRTTDNHSTLLNTGSEGLEWKNDLMAMNDEEFVAYCETQELS